MNLVLTSWKCNQLVAAVKCADYYHLYRMYILLAVIFIVIFFFAASHLFSPISS